MLLRTHVMLALLFVIIFFNHVSNKWVFVVMVLVATVVPDLDTGFSSYGRHLIFRPLQFFTKHRGIIHSFTLGVLLSVLIAVFWPMGAFGFFLGYSIHLFADSFTKDGIYPFWPLRWKSRGVLRSGGRVEESLFLGLIVLDVVLFFALVL